MEDLFSEGFEYVFTKKFQSDPVERRFSQYRSMSGGRFLVSLREVGTTEKILGCRALLKAGEHYWKKEAVDTSTEGDDVDTLLEDLVIEEAGIMEASLCENSNEVAHYIAGGIARKLQKTTGCERCSSLMTKKNPSSLQTGSYFENLSRGGLTNPSKDMSEFVSTVFAQTEFIDERLKGKLSVRKACCAALEKYAPQSIISCENHKTLARKRIIQFVVNTYYKNKQKILNDKVRKDSVKSFKTRQRNK